MPWEVFHKECREILKLAKDRDDLARHLRKKASRTPTRVCASLGKRALVGVLQTPSLESRLLLSLGSNTGFCELRTLHSLSPPDSETNLSSYSVEIL